MPTFRDPFPSSQRRPFTKSRFAQGLGNQSTFPTLINDAVARAAALSKNRFARMPHEPEDAKITGVTRSLNRRLLALNVNGSLMREPIISAKIA
jgi:hypothetical protein